MFTFAEPAISLQSIFTDTLRIQISLTCFESYCVKLTSRLEYTTQICIIHRVDK